METTLTSFPVLHITPAEMVTSHLMTIASLHLDCLMKSNGFVFTRKMPSVLSTTRTQTLLKFRLLTYWKQLLVSHRS